MAPEKRIGHHNDESLTWIVLPAKRTKNKLKGFKLNMERKGEECSDKLISLTRQRTQYTIRQR